ncbi:MAG: CapA family protein [Spirochaetes bacterium]|nr:CapA family protein [Spirochaetota bacterium]
MKKIWFFSITACVLSILAFGCKNAGTEDIITTYLKQSSTNNTNNEGYGTIIPGDGTDTGSSSSSSTSSTSSSGTTTPDTITLVFAGDTNLAGNVGTAVAGVGSGNYQYPFLYVADYLKSADLAFLNLESIISDTGKSSGSSALRADPSAVSGLTYAGIDVVSVANDHALDYGRTGLKDSLSNLTGAGVAYAGGGTLSEAYAPKIIEVNGTKFAFLAFYYDSSISETSIIAQESQTGVAWFYYKYAGPAIISAKKQADIVIVSLHMGTKGKTLPNLTQDHRAHYCIDQGAHLVVGHHPQAIQPVMKYMKGYIAFSLGNLVSDATDTAAKKGMILEVLVNDKKISSVNRKYVQINSNYQPVIQ